MFNKLTSIDFSYNSFETSMPDLLCNLSSLVHLDLSFNMFSGPIPASLRQLTRLEDLYLSYNQLSGNIPMSLGQLSNMRNLVLSHNSLVGVVTETHFINLTNLNKLDLSWNSIALTFSSHWIAPFQLEIFVASSCNIGPRFPNWLVTQKNLLKLDLSNTSIRDRIPEWFENILSDIVHLDLSNNQIYGKLPRFPSNINFLDLSNNSLSGHVPQTNGTLNLSPLVVNLSKNRFIGNIPVYLCKATGIEVLDLSKNKFSGRLPRCLGDLISLQVMDISYNNISGVVPSSLGSLTQLKSLHLHNNKFVGNLPLSLKNLRGLATMDIGNNFLTGRVPFWIGENLINLGILNLQSNKFTGKIPLQICQLNALRHLNLAHNNINGMIPRCFSNFSGMVTNQVNLEYLVDDFYEENILASMKGIELVYTKTIRFLTSLDLSSNNITGEIPNVLMNLVGLKSLNLSRNQLKGHIPRAIGNLSQMESLDLSINMLSGRIPESLTSLNFLGYLNLSFNNLSGPIPVGNQLQTLADPSIYYGNDGLCGPPVSASCKRNNSSYNHVGENEGQDDEGLWFYVGMGVGFAVGFMGLLGSLHFIRRWRVTYFKMLEHVYGWLIVSILVNLARLKRKVFE